MLFKHSKKSSSFNPKKRKVWGIQRETINMILEVSRENHPREFAGTLRTNKEGIIIEIMLLPGTLSGDKSALMQLHMLPVDFSVIGTVHSHPSPSFTPSSADLHLFEKFGHTHIIVAYPYNKDSWVAYDFRGNKIELEVVD